MKKGNIYKVKGKEQFFKLAGYWGEDIVLAPIGKEEDQVMIYSREDLRECLECGFLRKLHQVDTKEE